MRAHIVSTLSTLSKDSVQVTDQDMISWANALVKKNQKKSSMAHFKDPSLKTSHFFFDVLFGLKNGIVNYDLVAPGVTGTVVD